MQQHKDQTSEDSKINSGRSYVLIPVMATVLCNLWVAWGIMACAEWGVCEPKTSSLLHLWRPLPLANLEMPNGIVWVQATVLVDIWYLICMCSLSEFIHVTIVVPQWPDYPSSAAVSHQLLRQWQGPPHPPKSLALVGPMAHILSRMCLGLCT